MLLNTLIKDEKNINKELYSLGSFWSHKTNSAISNIKKKGLKDFRGLISGVGTGFSDNIVLDIENELNLIGRIVKKLIHRLPLINTILKLQRRQTLHAINNYLINEKIVYQNDKDAINLLKKYKFENTTNFGCVRKVTYLDKQVSIHYLEIANRIEELSSSFNFNKINSFFEIGGGFGANVHFLVTNFPNIKKIVYLDAVPNIYVGTEYLRSHFKDKVKDYTTLRNLDKISFSKNNDLEILCITPWLIEKLDIEFDHFHNAYSFVEMPKKIVENYAKFVKKFKTKETSLISYDDFTLNTVFKSNPEYLNKYFDDKLNVVKKNTLIDDHNNSIYGRGKDIYLTSK